MLYLLGIIFENPLPPHLYCPCCKSVHFKKDYRDGFDKMQNMVCPNDNTPTSGDGRNIPWQTLWGYGEFCLTFQINLPAEIFEDVKEMAQNHWLKKRPYNEAFSVGNCTTAYILSCFATA